jgi:predicted nuclease of predicted toxin-antitoxin system
MILWLDAQMPPSLAGWLCKTLAIDAVAVRDIGLRDAEDKAIFAAAREAGATLVSKDQDFVELVQRLGTPPQLLWVTCGNVSNARMQKVMAATLPRAIALIEAGEAIVEIADIV